MRRRAEASRRRALEQRLERREPGFARIGGQELRHFAAHQHRAIDAQQRRGGGIGVGDRQALEVDGEEGVGDAVDRGADCASRPVRRAPRFVREFGADAAHCGSARRAGRGAGAARRRRSPAISPAARHQSSTSRATATASIAQAVERGRARIAAAQTRRGEGAEAAQRLGFRRCGVQRCAAAPRGERAVDRGAPHHDPGRPFDAGIHASASPPCGSIRAGQRVA